MRLSNVGTLVVCAALFLTAVGAGFFWGRASTTRSNNAAGTDNPATRSAQSSPALTAVDKINATLPSGFRADVYAGGINYPVTVAADPDGNVYVGSLVNHKGEVYAYRSKADGSAGKRNVFAADLPPVTGILVSRGRVIVSTRGTVFSFRDSNSDGIAEERIILFSDLPVSKEIPIHSNQGMARGPDGALYFGVGASCNACVEDNPMQATVARCNPKAHACKVYARGLRNVYDVAFRPSDGSLFGADNGADTIGNATLDIEDEINEIEAGKNYGWPFCWGKSRGLHCTGAEPALVEIQPHSAPAGLSFYTGKSFPHEYREDLFVSLWGARKVIRVNLEPRGDTYRTTVIDFVRLNRPVDVVTNPDGDLLVADADAGRVYRIRYEGES